MGHAAEVFGSPWKSLEIGASTITLGAEVIEFNRLLLQPISRYPHRYPQDKRLIFDANRAQVPGEMARPAALRTKRRRNSVEDTFGPLSKLESSSQRASISAKYRLSSRTVTGAALHCASVSFCAQAAQSLARPWHRQVDSRSVTVISGTSDA
jgi:hypothetical protein